MVSKVAHVFSFFLFSSFFPSPLWSWPYSAATTIPVHARAVTAEEIAARRQQAKLMSQQRSAVAEATATNGGCVTGRCPGNTVLLRKCSPGIVYLAPHRNLLHKLQTFAMHCYICVAKDV